MEIEERQLHSLKVTGTKDALSKYFLFEHSRFRFIILNNNKNIAEF